jgi:hypothetical protein
MKEKLLENRIKLHAAGRAILFKNVVGNGWVGQSKRVGADVLIKNARPLQAGLVKGSSDLIGWTVIEILPAHVGKKLAIFTAIELKTGNVATTPEQANFINAVRGAGGIAGIAYDEADFDAILNPLYKPE